MHITILGKRWGLRFVKRREMPDADGECDPPNMPGKEIRIIERQPEFDKLDTLIHEMAHAARWDASEEWVAEFATDIARALWRLGYRKNGDNDG